VALRPLLRAAPLFPCGSYTSSQRLVRTHIGKLASAVTAGFATFASLGYSSCSPLLVSLG
jgi:hypothetical protein